MERNVKKTLAQWEIFLWWLPIPPLTVRPKHVVNPTMILMEYVRESSFLLSGDNKIKAMLTGCN